MDPDQEGEMTTMAASNARNGSWGGSIAVRERERVAVELRVQGYSYAEIGDQLGISGRMANRIVNRAMNRVLREPVAQLIDLETARLDALWQAMWPRALRGSARHAEVCVRICERRARLLGLDQPAKLEMRMSAEEVDALDREIEQLLDSYRRGEGGS
jgi:DNA-binding CsgD family transcriptional regulator